jgi:hypothetical protein
MKNSLPMRHTKITGIVDYSLVGIQQAVILVCTNHSFRE